jgi:three-Cys-motif partner protein
MFELKPPSDDKQYIPTVGEWSHDKYYFIKGYIDAFTTAMKKKAWSGLHYIDLFAGAGIVRLEGSKNLEWGSPLIAAQAPHPFTRLHLCEKNKRNYIALKERVERIKPDSQILQGDANKKIREIVKEIPKNTLSLAFLDPYGLHLDFETLKILSDVRADIIIFFPDHLDALRNWEKYYLNNPRSNLDRCLGPSVDWRSIINKTAREHLAEVLRELYVKQIKSLGYTQFEYERIMMKGHPLYILIFCSRSELAAKLWRGISQKKPNGQRTFKFQPNL